MMLCSRCGRNNESLVSFCHSCGTDLRATSHDPRVLDTRCPSYTVVQYAGFWRRLLASFIDGIVLLFGNFVVGFVMMPPLSIPGLEPIGNSLEILTAWLYFALMESSSRRGTLGKMVLGIVVTDMDGNRVSFGRATGRHFAKILSAMIFLVGYVMAGFTSKKQALHDMIAGCLVLKMKESHAADSEERISVAPCAGRQISLNSISNKKPVTPKRDNAAHPIIGRANLTWKYVSSSWFLQDLLYPPIPADMKMSNNRSGH